MIFSADVPDNISEIEVAGAITQEGYPVNRKTYRVSRSKKNLNKARDSFTTPELTKRQHGDMCFYLAPRT